MNVPSRPTRGSLSLVISVLALVIALSGTAYAALADGSVRTRHLAANAVTTPKLAPDAVRSGRIAPGAVTASDLRGNAVTGSKVLNGSLGLRDFGGLATGVTVTITNAVAIAANDCRPIALALFNPEPEGILGSMVVGTITDAGGGAVVNNTGAILPTLVTETSQNGAMIHLVVCAGPSAQTIPAGSVARYSLIRP